MVTGQNSRKFKSISFGYTLMELIVVMLILAIVGSLTVRLISSTMKTYETVLLRSDLVNEARLFSARFYREVKPLPFPDSLLAADSKSIQWKTHSGKIYTFTITGNSITRQLNGGSADLLVKYVDDTNSNFSYYDSTYTLLSPLPLSATNRKKVRLLGADITFERGAETFTTHQRIYLANMRRW